MSIRFKQRPIIGVTTYLQQASSGVWTLPAVFLPAHYLHGVSRAGGVATLLPPQPADEAIFAQVIGGLDGLIVAGGSDVDPALYGHKRHGATDEPARDRDAWEFGLLKAALAARLPILGVCRGAQILNTVLGGTIHQHLPELLGHTQHQVGRGIFNINEVRTVEGTRVAGLVGESHFAQCYHHQAIADVGKGLVVSARDDEGVIEAIELDPQLNPDAWVVGVQWHPEQGLDDLRLFTDFVNAAASHQIHSLNDPAAL